MEVPVIATAITLGIQGPRGPMGGVMSFEYDQGTPATVWNITHNLAMFPGVTIVDTSGNVVEAAVQYIDNNNVTVTFNAAFAGKAYLNGTDAFEYDQSSPEMVWNIAHGLGRFPSVTIVDTSGTIIQAQVQYIDSANIQISFYDAFAGKAYLN